MIGCWTWPGTTSVYIKKTNVRVTMELNVPKSHVSMLTLSIIEVHRVLHWERPKEVLSLQMLGDHDREISSFSSSSSPPPQKKNVTIIMGKEGENRGRRSSMKKNPKIPLFGLILIYLPNLLFGAYLLLLVHIQYTPSEGPKGFKMCFLEIMTVEKGPLTWDNFVAHDINNPSISPP